MNLKVNGRDIHIDIKSEPVTVSRLLDHLKIQSAKVAVEKNLVIVDHSDYANEELKDGDIIEIVHFVGGG